MTLSSFLTKLKSCRGKPIKIKQNEKPFCEDISQIIENDPGLLDLSNLNDVDHCGLCGASATLPVSQNLATKRWIVFLSGKLSLQKSLLHYHCVRKPDFVAKYASMFFVGRCVVNLPVGSILVSKEKRRPAVYTTWKIWKKNSKAQLWDKKQNRGFFLATL